MPTTYAQRYTADRVLPAERNDLAQRGSVKLAASKTFAKGAILGEKTGNDEVQSLIISATGGTFTVTFGGQTTSATAYNASAATLQANLEALSTIGTGNVTVSRNRSVYTLTEQASTDGGNFALSISVNGGPAQTTALIAYNASTATIDAAIEALTNVGASGVTVSGSTGGPYTLTFAPSVGDVAIIVVNDTTVTSSVIKGGVIVALSTTVPYTYVVTFKNDLGKTNVAAMTTDATSLTGGSGTATVTTVTAGSAGTIGEYDAYDPTATNGLQIPKCFLELACITDSDGKITFGASGSVSDNLAKQQSAPIFNGGRFSFSDVPQMTEAILALMGGKIISGSIAGGGVFEI